MIKKIILTSAICLSTNIVFANQQDKEISFFDQESVSNFFVMFKTGSTFYSSYIPQPSNQAPIGRDYVNLGHAYFMTLGYKITPYFDISLEYNYNRNSFDKFKVFRNATSASGQQLQAGKSYAMDGNVSTHELMTNFTYNIVNETKLTPFVGFGIGIINYREDNACGHPRNTKFGGQLLGGFDYRVTPRLSLILDYQYVKLSKFRIKNNCLSPKVNHRHHSVSTGLKVFI